MKTDLLVVSLLLVLMAHELQTRGTARLDDSKHRGSKLSYISLGYFPPSFLGATFLWFTLSCCDLLHSHSFLHCAGHQLDYTFFSLSHSAASKLHSFHNCP
jgi:hypothetical protein